MVMDVDGGWAWVVLAASVGNIAILGAFTISIGMFQTEFNSHFEGSTASISIICAVCASLQMFPGPVASFMCGVFGYRSVLMVGGATMSVGLVLASFASSLSQLMIFYGVIVGLGFGTCYTPATAVTARYFSDKRVLANGIALSSAGVGMMTGPHLISWLIDQYGWRFALAVLGCITSQMIVFASLIYPFKRETGYHRRYRVSCLQNSNKYRPENSKNDITKPRGSVSVASLLSCCKLTNSENKGIIGTLKSFKFWIVCCQQYFLLVGYSIQIVHFPSHVQSVGVSMSRVPTLFTAYGISLIITRLAGGVLLYYLKYPLIYTSAVLQLLFGTVIVLMPVFAKTFPLLIVYQVLFASSYGLTYVMVTPMLVELFGVDNMTMAYGILMCVGGVSYLTGAPIAGFLYDTTGSYNVGFHIAGCTVLTGGLILLSIPIIQRCQKHQKVETEVEVPLSVSVPSGCIELDDITDTSETVKQKN